MTRTQYITVAELNEILGTVYSNNSETLRLIYEASELLKYHMFDKINDYTVSTAPNELKLATAYQVKHMETGLDETYSSDSMTIGKFSISNSEKGEHRKIAPKTQRYLVEGGLIRRVL